MLHELIHLLGQRINCSADHELESGAPGRLRVIAARGIPWLRSLDVQISLICLPQKQQDLFVLSCPIIPGLPCGNGHVIDEEEYSLV